jgi:ATP-dependent helicase HrpA
VLVFLPGESQIRDTALELRKFNQDALDVLPLYSRLGSKEQQRIFQPQKTSKRRIILATNVAETSLTVPGIRYVIDSGQARIKRYSVKSKIQRLPIEAISRASANQRKGRCGRVSEGVCIRLYDEADFLQRPEFTEPEIKRSNLAEVILKMYQLNLGNIEDFPFIEPPEGKQIRDGLRLLQELSALKKNQLTAIGRAMASLPLDPKISRALIAGEEHNSLDAMLIIASYLSIQDPREFPQEKKAAAQQAHAIFKKTKSADDFDVVLSLWDWFENLWEDKSKSVVAKECKRHFLNWNRMREWRGVHRQLKLAMKKKSKNAKENKSIDKAAIGKALLTGFAANVGIQVEKSEYQGTRGRQFYVFPGSVVKKMPAWLLAGELLETSRVFAHQVMAIEPEWLLSSVSHLLKSEYVEPYWCSKTQQVKAKERILFSGLLIDEKPLPDYSKIDARTSRDLFIREGLGAFTYKTREAFWLHNKKLLGRLTEEAEKIRNNDLFIFEDNLIAFYQKNIPEQISSPNEFNAWYKLERQQNPQLLCATEDDIRSGINDGGLEQFPSTLIWDGVEYPLDYRFEPGHKEDGMSVIITMAQLSSTPDFLFEWLVPGLLQDKCQFLLKSLPKKHRKMLVPIPATAALLTPCLIAENIPLSKQLSAALKNIKSLDIPADYFDEIALDAWYKPHYRLVDKNKKIIAKSDNLQQLKQQYIEQSEKEIAAEIDHGFPADGILSWSFPDLPEKWLSKVNKSDVVMWPALVDLTQSVGVQLFSKKEEALLSHRQGLIRLLMLEDNKTANYLKKNLLKSIGKKQIIFSVLGQLDSLVDAIIKKSYNDTVLDEADDLPFTKQNYNGLKSKYLTGVTAYALSLERLLNEIAMGALEVRQQLESLKKVHLSSANQNLVLSEEQHIHCLLHKDFVVDTPVEYLYYFPRYLKASLLFLEKSQKNTEQYAALLATINGWEEKKQQVKDDIKNTNNAHYNAFLWILEEYRVSLFAQTLGTKIKVSEQRLHKQWLAINI